MVPATHVAVMLMTLHEKSYFEYSDLSVVMIMLVAGILFLAECATQIVSGATYTFGND
jgi:hypothetical protein